MNDQDYIALLAAIERFDTECVATPHDARRALQEEGFLDEDGVVSDIYAEAVNTAA